MKKIYISLSILVLVLASVTWAGNPPDNQTNNPADAKAAMPGAPTAIHEKPYLIGASDLLDISVWGEAALSRQVSVRTDGFISLPLVGDIAAVGKTPSQLQKNIESALLKYFKDPHCAVIVIEPRSKRFYVEGQVAHPGFFILDRDLYLTQAISLAGGLTQWADSSGIIILRIEENVQKRINANYQKILKGKDVNVLIKPGDTIIIP